MIEPKSEIKEVKSQITIKSKKFGKEETISQKEWDRYKELGMDVDFQVLKVN